MADIEASESTHTAPERLAYLSALKKVAKTLIAWAHKCSDRARTLAAETATPTYAENLTRLADALLHVPEHPPRSFYEAVLTIYVCFSADPDSVGTLDRYLAPSISGIWPADA